MLAQCPVGLFLDPGMGKTATVLAAFKILKDLKMVDTMLIVVPIRPMYDVWPNEMEKWTEFGHFVWSIIHGDVDDRDAAIDGADIYMVNPEGLLWLLEHHRSFVESIDVLCIDESSKFKASNTKRFKGLKPFIGTFARRWCLTGTPTPNGIMDLFGQVFILDEGQSLGRYITHFRNKFFYQTGFGGYEWKPLPGSFDLIVEKTAPLVLQLSAEDHLEMPDLMNITREVTLEPYVMKTYRQVESEFITVLGENTLVAANAAVAGIKCRQIANGAVYINDDHEWGEVHGQKLEALEELLEELGGASTLILYEFKHDAERIIERFGIPNLTGKTPKKSSALISGFNGGTIPYLLGHPASMGHGINLQAECHHVIWFGIPWNLEHYDQATRRVYRQGQKNTVFVYHIVARDTLDETVLGVLGMKDRNQNRLREALGAARDGNEE
jgi:SNF2 family DNA or RNA helicase